MKKHKNFRAPVDDYSYASEYLGLGAGGPLPQDPESMKGAPGKLMGIPSKQMGRKKTMPVDPNRTIPVYQDGPKNF